MNEIDFTFDGPIGVDVKGSMWTCVEIPDSVALLGTGKTVKVDATVDGTQLPRVGLLVTGTGGHMLSLNAKVRARLQKDLGDVVTVRIQSPAG